MMNGMMFGGEGPVMQGTWYNPDTGDAFTVRDSFFEDNQYIVSTTDGRYLKYDQIQSYVQSDMKLEELKKLGKSNKQKQEDKLPDAVMSILDSDENDTYSDLIIPEDYNLNKSSIGNIYADKQESRVFNPNASNSNKINITMNYAIIEKALKNTDVPKMNISLDWKNYPKKQIEMLKDIMEISEEEIIEWYLNNVEVIEIINRFKDSIRQHISTKTESTEKISTTPESVQVEAPKPRAKKSKNS